MNPSVALALAIGVAFPDAPNEVVVMCVCCYNDRDPRWELAAHRAPNSAECMCCADARRWREGMLFVVQPKPSDAAMLEAAE